MKTKNMKHMLARMAVCLVLALLSTFTARATAFITDVKVVGAETKSEVNQYTASLVADGWTLVDKDLNKGADGDYIYLLYKTEECTDSVNRGNYITDFGIRVGQYAPDQFIGDDHYTYTRVSCAGSTTFVNSKGDLNRGAGGEYIYLYYVKGKYSRYGKHTALTSIYFNNDNEDGVGETVTNAYNLEPQYNGQSHNLNAGCEGADAIYMHMNYGEVYGPSFIGCGTQEYPYIIRGAEEWEMFAYNVSIGLEADKYYKGWCFDVNPGHSVGTIDHPFTGHFDGDGGWAACKNTSAPFRYIRGATIENLYVWGKKGNVVSNGDFAGGIVDYALNDIPNTIRNCAISDDVTLFCTRYGGGIVGHASAGTLIIDHCSVEGVISGFTEYAAGMVGWCMGGLTLTINDCVVACSFSPVGYAQYHLFGCKQAAGTVNASVTHCYHLYNGPESTATDPSVISGTYDGVVSKDFDRETFNTKIHYPGTHYYIYSTEMHAYYANIHHFQENFECASMPNGWEAVTDSPNNNWTISSQQSGVRAGEGNYSAFFSIGSVEDPEDFRPGSYLYSPVIDVGNTGNLTLSYKYYMNVPVKSLYYGTYTIRPNPIYLTVQYLADGDGSWQDRWQTLKRYRNNPDSEDAWKEETFELPQINNTLQLRFYYNHFDPEYVDGDDRVAIDLIDVRSIGKPSDLALSFVPGNDSTVILDWSPNYPATAWEICLDGNESDIITVTEHPYTITGININTGHTAKVRNIYQEKYSGWSDTFFFPYTIHYDLNGGTISGQNPDIYFPDGADITLIAPTRTNYTFAGWTGTGLTEPTINVTIPSGSTGCRTYTATWTPIEYTITYNLNGGSMDNPTTYNVESGTITLNAPTREGCTFAGWTGTGLYLPAMTVTIPAGTTGNRTYTANWTIIEYTITYNLNGGSVATANPTTYNVESETITLNTPTLAGHYFTGWTGTGLGDPAMSVTIPTGSIGDRTYTATWGEVPIIPEWAGSGTESDPYLIESYRQLDLLAYHVNGSYGYTADTYAGIYFQLTNDITYPHTTAWNDTTTVENNFDVIGNGTKAFKGIFDGNGHTISGIRVHKGDLTGVALIGELGSYGKVKNLTIADTRIIGRSDVAAVVGRIEYDYCYVENCRVAANVLVHSEMKNAGRPLNLGGVVGLTYDYFGHIIGCVSEATLSAAVPGNIRIAGGIVGLSYNQIINCFAIGAVVPGGIYHGAIVGMQNPYDNDPQANNYYTACTVNGVANATNVGCGVHYSWYDHVEYENHGDLDGYRLAHTITLTDPRIDIAGTRTVYNVSGITAIGTSAMIYNDGTTSTIYSGEGQTITLTVTPDENYEAIVAYNDTVITPVDGVYSFTMPAADVTVSATFKSTKYDFANGELHLIQGNFNSMQDNFDADITYHRDEVLKVTADEGVRFTGVCAQMFQNFTNCTEIDLSNVNTSEMTYATSMFEGCTSLKKLNITGWDMQQVNYMDNMFTDCNSLREIDLSGVKINMNASMDEMFSTSGTNTGVCKLALPAGMGVTASMHLKRGYYYGYYSGEYHNSGWQLLGDKTVVSGSAQDDGVTYATLPAQPTTATFVWKQMPDDFVLELPDGEDNSQTVAAWDGVKTNVCLTGRKLYKDGNWNTICLPFHTNIDGFGAEDEIRYLDTWNYYNEEGWTNWEGEIDEDSIYIYRTGFDETTGILRLYFSDCYGIDAGVPYLVRWAEDTEHPIIESPTFNGVTISNVKDDALKGHLAFAGSYSPVAIGSEGDRYRLYLGAGNTLYWPNGEMTINASQPSFVLNAASGGGDLSGDGRLMNDDIQPLINIILGKTQDYDPTTADVTGENGVTLADLTALVTLIRSLNANITRIVTNLEEHNFNVGVSGGVYEPR